MSGDHSADAAAIEPARAASGGRFLLCVWPFAGHIHPNLAVAQALREAGHEVAFYTGATAAPAIQREGFALFPFRRVDEQRVEKIVLSPEGILSSSGKPLRTKRLWREWVLETVPEQVADLEETIAAWAPEAILTDPAMWAPFLILHETKKIPVAVLSVIPACHISRDQGPILGFPLPKPRSSYGRLRGAILRKLSRAFLSDVPRDANRLRAGHGLPPIRGSVSDFAAQMPLYMVPSSPEFDYERTDLPPSVEYVGPCLWSRISEEAAPEWLSQRDSTVPLIYASEGTVHLKPRLLHAVAAGLRDLPVEAVLTTGKHRDPDKLDLGPRPLAPNVRAERWVDLNALLPHLQAMVTIGGPSTLMAALARGIPVVIVPFTWITRKPPGESSKAELAFG